MQVGGGSRDCSILQPEEEEEDNEGLEEDNEGLTVLRGSLILGKPACNWLEEEDEDNEGIDEGIDDDDEEEEEEKEDGGRRLGGGGEGEAMLTHTAPVLLL